MLKSAVGVRVSVSVLLLLLVLESVTPDGGSTVAVLVRFPVAVADTVPLSVRVTLWPEARLKPVQAPVLLS